MLHRPRRLRRGTVMRQSLQDVHFKISDLVMPLFLKEGIGLKAEVSSMPGVYQMSPEVALEEILSLSARGITKFILFGVVDSDKKDSKGCIAHQVENPVVKLLRLVNENNVDALMMVDLCYCEYTSHGHCGVLCEDEHLTVDNDQTIQNLAEQAVFLAQQGADVIAPSGAMDGMVEAIRNGLDAHGFSHIPIMSYSIKYASHMYGPFRDAADGAPQFGDRRGYQMDFRRSREWAIEAELDCSEGADILMVKPGGPYLDILAKLRERTELPLAVYQVSGEYSMLIAAAERGWLDLECAAMEWLYAMKRAGADMIISYFAPQVLRWRNR